MEHFVARQRYDEAGQSFGNTSELFNQDHNQEEGDDQAGHQEDDIATKAPAEIKKSKPGTWLLQILRLTRVR